MKNMFLNKKESIKYVMELVFTYFRLSELSSIPSNGSIDGALLEDQSCVLSRVHLALCCYGILLHSILS
jgi:hypothetical protein